MVEREYKNRISEYHDIDEKICPALPLKGLHIELSNVCNHSCLFCANRKMTRKKGFIDEIFLKKILEDAYKLGFRDVGYYANGEPFVSKNIVEYIKWAKKMGYTYVYVDTNGAATDFDKIKEALDAGLDSIKFSINGTDEKNYELIHGKAEFSKVIQNLKKTYEYKVNTGKDFKIYVSIAVTRFTENSVDEFVLFCKKYADDVVTNSVIEMGGYITEELKYLRTTNESDFNQGMKIPCYMLWNGLYITYEGYATACCADFQNYFVYADLNETSIEKAWNNDVIVNLRKRHLEQKIEGLPCVTCVYGKKEDWKPLIECFSTKINDTVLGKADIESRLKLFEE